MQKIIKLIKLFHVNKAKIDYHDPYIRTYKFNLPGVEIRESVDLDSKKIDSLKSRFVDLHLIIRRSWILPIRNYSLKTVANWMGFEWKQKNVSGSKALYWWIQYKTTLNDVFLKKIIKYNRDDCLATLHIAKWLIKSS